ncbi:OmpA family protein [Hymenobacter sp.]|uniref:OmpA family protein n=1 Tax=Hymenobacter sp. TaxID=1898978 RepID=UPI00286A8A38|nr:OmpA family protein [Hymenobacter sp.]
MKRSFWYGLGTLLLGGFCPAGPAHAQFLTGVWQGVEADPGATLFWPAVLRVQAGKGTAVFGVLYQEVGGRPANSATFQMQGRRTSTGLQLNHLRLLEETQPTDTGFWCQGAITLRYDAAQEKLTGRATYRPDGDCDAGLFTFYRVKLKSTATVAAGVLSTLRVTGRDVRWYADAALKQPVATGNTYRAKLSKTTTFYLAQGYYSTSQSPVVPITIRVTGAAAPKAVAPTRARPVRPDTLRPSPAPILAPRPVVLPTVLFRVGTAELLPEARPALDQLAAELRAQPTVQLRVAGHTDRVGEPEKNQALSEQRAEAVRAYLVAAGVAAGRISTVGYGDARPRYPSPDARNRRVEVEAAE